jgi:hypothetical protein
MFRFAQSCAVVVMQPGDDFHETTIVYTIDVLGAIDGVFVLFISPPIATKSKVQNVESCLSEKRYRDPKDRMSDIKIDHWRCCCQVLVAESPSKRVIKTFQLMIAQQRVFGIMLHSFIYRCPSPLASVSRTHIGQKE